MFRDPNHNLFPGCRNEFWDRYRKTLSKFGSLLNSDNPDLSALRDSGTKMLTFRGLEDPNVPYENTIEYRNRVDRIMGGSDKLNKYYRLFLGPGVLHCRCGSDPEPSTLTYMDALMTWVEKGIPPQNFRADRECTPSLDNHTRTMRCPDGQLTRDLCLWPTKQMYIGEIQGMPQAGLVSIGRRGHTRPSTAHSQTLRNAW
ncbi:uncharacterized protein yc1106_06852 [Curvularia clavata]|uniref:Carboxylic ester hydrolase n=1 Tax=Curvularia clavata TaxID=95742 RepID=A0A9Q8ZG51_CURCL|nr:uncharacterized protein yc1106_06852 [Curvularia clavata]